MNAPRHTQPDRGAPWRTRPKPELPHRESSLYGDDSPGRRACARYLIAADRLFKRASRTSDPDKWIELIEAANVAQRAARAELRTPLRETA